MARFKVVQSFGWQNSYAAPLFESDNEENALVQASRFRDALGEAYEVVDAWNPANQFPANTTALLTTSEEVVAWLEFDRPAWPTSII